MGDQSRDIAQGIVDRLQAAWNDADGRAFGGQFAEDADFVDIRGDYHHGRREISAGHQGILDTIYRGSRVEYALVGARPLTGDAIVAHVRAIMNAPTGPLAGENHATMTLILVRTDGEWKIAAFQNTLVPRQQRG